MAATGRPIEIEFTPLVDSTVQVTVTFSAAGSGSDWGAGHFAKAFCEQDGSTSYGLSASLANARGYYTVMGSFDVVAGQLVKCGLYAGVSGAASITLYDVNGKAQVTGL